MKPVGLPVAGHDWNRRVTVENDAASNGKMPGAAPNLHASFYGRFTEGFDTANPKEAKTLRSDAEHFAACRA